MPGIFGVLKRGSDRDSLSSLMEGMATSMSDAAQLGVGRFIGEDGIIGLGRTSLGVTRPNGVQPVRDLRGSFLIAFHGELYGKSGVSSSEQDILDLFLDRGDACASDLNGVFHFAIHDIHSNTIKLFSDKFGLLPLYYSILPDGMIFAGEVKAILQERRVSRNIDPQSFGDFFHYSQILGQKTLFRDIHLLAPGSVLTYDLGSGKTDLKPYWKLSDIFTKQGNYDPGVSSGDAVTLLVESIRARAITDEAVGLSLSGGLDSRAILAGIGNHAKAIHTYTLGLEGCADQLLAERVARQVGTKHEFVELGGEYLEDFQGLANGTIRLSDGMYHPDECTEMLALEYFKRAPFKILLRGHGGEIAKASLAFPVMVKPEVHSYTSSRQAIDFIFGAGNIVTPNIELAKLFTPGFYSQIRTAARESLDESCREASEILTPVDTCIYFYIQEYVRRQAVASLEIFRSQVEIRMPFMDEEFLKRLLCLPPVHRNQGEIQIALIKKCMPELVKIPNSNTGAPLDAGPVRLYMTDKFNSLMRRLRIKGYRHYNEFEDWQRKSFKSTIEKILFSPESLNRDLYNPIYLRTLFNEHISGKSDHARILGTAVGLELWFENFVDS